MELPKTAQRLLWFFALWAAGVIAVAVVAFTIRMMIK
jgi:Protein of unknown function (DUF2474)